MSRSAEKGGIHDQIRNTLDRFSQQNLIDSMGSVACEYFGAEGEGLKPIGDDRRAINCCKSGESIDCRLQSKRRYIIAIGVTLQEGNKIGKWCDERVTNRLHDRCLPLV